MRKGREGKDGGETDSEWEVLRLLYYEVEVAGNTVVPKTMFGSVEPTDVIEGRFEIMHALDGDLVCIVEKHPSLGNRVQIMHCFKTNESWPYMKDTGLPNNENAFTKRNNLYEEAHSDNPDLPRLGS